MSEIYKNEEGVYIRVTTDKNGKTHIDFYNDDPKGPHTSTHININKDSKDGTIVQKDSDGEKTTTGFGCYLTSACMEHFKNEFDDNCYELTVLRWFRDNYVSKNDIEHYYNVAPSIVEEINKEEKNSLIYDYIYDNVVDYCVTEIEKGNYMNAYNRYKESIISLEEHYIRQTDKQTISKKSRKLINLHV